MNQQDRAYYQRIIELEGEFDVSAGPEIFPIIDPEIELKADRVLAAASAEGEIAELRPVAVELLRRMKRTKRQSRLRAANLSLGDGIVTDDETSDGGAE